MKIRPYGWHGVSDKLSKMVKDRLNIRMDANDSVQPLNMTLDEFMAKWQDKVIIMPDIENGEYIAGITEHSNFGQR